MACSNPQAEAQVEAAQRMLSPQWAANRIDLGNVLTSTPNAKTLNGKAESSDSGAESEEEEAQEGMKGAEQSDNGNLWVMS